MGICISDLYVVPVLFACQNNARLANMYSDTIDRNVQQNAFDFDTDNWSLGLFPSWETGNDHDKMMESKVLLHL